MHIYQKRTSLVLRFHFLSDQNALIYPPHWANFVTVILDPGTANILVTIAAAAGVTVLHSHVSLTQPLELNFGRSQVFVPQKAVVAKVTANTKVFFLSVKYSFQAFSPRQTILVSTLPTLKRHMKYKWSRD